MIQLEDLRHYIAIYRQVETRDSIGQVKYENQLVNNYWASKYNWQNREKYEGKNLIESDIVIFRIYWDENIGSDNTIILDGRTYQITGTKELGYREGLELTAQFKSNR